MSIKNAINFLTLLLGFPQLVNSQEMRGSQYCEILFGGPLEADGSIPDDFQMTVGWNGLNRVCPNDLFYNMTEEDVTAFHGEDKAAFVLFNGVRQFLIDELNRQDEEDRPQLPFDVYDNGLFMVRVAQVVANPAERWVPASVDRKVTFTWYANQTVFELVAPNCSAIYTMQSFMIGRPGEWGVPTEEELFTLVEDGRISPPEGWIYRVRVLDEDLVIIGVNGVTEVLSDDIRNSYSRHDLPFDTTLCPPPPQNDEDEEVEVNSTNGDNDDDDDDNNNITSGKKKGGKRKQKVRSGKK